MKPTDVLCALQTTIAPGNGNLRTLREIYDELKFDYRYNGIKTRAKNVIMHSLHTELFLITSAGDFTTNSSLTITITVQKHERINNTCTCLTHVYVLNYMHIQDGMCTRTNAHAHAFPFFLSFSILPLRVFFASLIVLFCLFVLLIVRSSNCSFF